MMANEDGNNNDNIPPLNISINASNAGNLNQGNNIVSTGEGNDKVDGQGGVNIVDSGSGNDSSRNSSNASDTCDIVMGGSGNDIIQGPSNGYLNARGGTGSDAIVGGTNSDNIFGDGGNDWLLGGGGDDFLVGGQGADIIMGDKGDDTLVGGRGNDWLWGGRGSDTFVFGKDDGGDIIWDFDANDTIDLSNLGGTITWDQLLANISSSRGSITIIDLSDWGGGRITLNNVNYKSLTQDNFILPDGSTSSNTDGVFQIPENSVYMGTSGDDTIEISSTDNLVVTGGEGDDKIVTGKGDDILQGGEGDDTLEGKAGADFLEGGEGDDTLSGGRGHDLLQGGKGSDILKGNSGKDTLSGGEGDDTLTGGRGADIFVFAPKNGKDNITDFTVNSDTIDLTSYNNLTSFDQLEITQNGSDTVIDLSSHGGGTITLDNVDLNTLDDNDFSFYVPLEAEVDSM